MSIRINKEKCIGCGACVSICSDVFELGGDGKANVISEENVECANKAADLCPVKVIVVS